MTGERILPFWCCFSNRTRPWMTFTFAPPISMTFSCTKTLQHIFEKALNWSACIFADGLSVFFVVRKIYTFLQWKEEDISSMMLSPTAAASKKHNCYDGVPNLLSSVSMVHTGNFNFNLFAFLKFQIFCSYCDKTTLWWSIKHSATTTGLLVCVCSVWNHVHYFFHKGCHSLRNISETPTTFSLWRALPRWSTVSLFLWRKTTSWTHSFVPCCSLNASQIWVHVCAEKEWKSGWFVIDRLPNTYNQTNTEPSLSLIHRSSDPYPWQSRRQGHPWTQQKSFFVGNLQGI